MTWIPLVMWIYLHLWELTEMVHLLWNVSNVIWKSLWTISMRKTKEIPAYLNTLSYRFSFVILPWGSTKNVRCLTHVMYTNTSHIWKDPKAWILFLPHPRNNRLQHKGIFFRQQMKNTRLWRVPKSLQGQAARKSEKGWTSSPAKQMKNIR